MKTAVYRHINATGQVIYVGCSCCPSCRFTNHRSVSSWAQDVTRIEIEWYKTRKEALAAERRLIIELSPMYNAQLSGRGMGNWAANQGYIILSQWADLNGITVREFANLSGFALLEAKSLLTEVRHIQIPKAQYITAVTWGAVQTAAWQRRHQPWDQPPALRPLTRERAKQEYNRVVERHLKHGTRGQIGKMMDHLLAVRQGAEASA